MALRNVYHIFVGLVEIALEAKQNVTLSGYSSESQLRLHMIDSHLKYLKTLLPVDYTESVLRNYRYTLSNAKEIPLEVLASQFASMTSASAIANLLYEFQLTTQMIEANNHG